MFGYLGQRSPDGIGTVRERTLLSVKLSRGCSHRIVPNLLRAFSSRNCTRILEGGGGESGQNSSPSLVVLSREGPTTVNLQNFLPWGRKGLICRGMDSTWAHWRKHHCSWGKGIPLRCRLPHPLSSTLKKTKKKKSLNLQGKGFQGHRVKTLVDTHYNSEEGRGGEKLLPAEEGQKQLWSPRPQDPGQQCVNQNPSESLPSTPSSH